MKLHMNIQLLDEKQSSVVSGNITLSSPRLAELIMRVVTGNVNDLLTKEVYIQAINAELMANPANVMNEVCKDFANNLMQYNPNPVVKEE